MADLSPFASAVMGLTQRSRSSQATKFLNALRLFKPQTSAWETPKLPTPADVTLDSSDVQNAGAEEARRLKAAFGFAQTALSGPRGPADSLKGAFKWPV